MKTPWLAVTGRCAAKHIREEYNVESVSYFFVTCINDFPEDVWDHKIVIYCGDHFLEKYPNEVTAFIDRKYLREDNSPQVHYWRSTRLELIIQISSRTNCFSSSWKNFSTFELMRIYETLYDQPWYYLYGRPRYGKRRR